MKQGVDFFFFLLLPHLPTRAYICLHAYFMHSHYFTRTHTRARSHTLPVIGSSHFQLVPSFLLRSKRFEWWTCSDRVRVLACLSAGITPQQCLLVYVCVCVCVCVCVYASWNSLPFFSLIPFKAVGGKHWQIYWSTLDLKAICQFGLGWRIMGVGCMLASMIKCRPAKVGTMIGSKHMYIMKGLQGYRILIITQFWWSFRKAHNLKPWMWPWIEILSAGLKRTCILDCAWKHECKWCCVMSSVIGSEGEIWSVFNCKWAAHQARTQEVCW